MTTYNIKQGDCMQLLHDIADNSVDLVLCDPPYGNMTGIEKSSITKNGTADHSFRFCGWAAIDPNALFIQLNRILKPFARCILFSQEPYTSNLITSAIDPLPFSQRAFWKKEHFANVLGCKNQLVNYTEDIVIFTKQGYDTEKSHPLRSYFKEEQAKCAGVSFKKILNNNMASHYFTNGLQFTIPSEENYKKLQTTGHFNRPYSEIKAIHDKWNSQRGAVFNLWDGGKFKGNIFEYKRDKEKLHPTQKPVALLEDLIKTYSKDGALVVDFCMGSGSTGIAALNCNRDFIGFELDENYFNIADKRLKERQEHLF